MPPFRSSSADARPFLKYVVSMPVSIRMMRLLKRGRIRPGCGVCPVTNRSTPYLAISGVTCVSDVS